MWIPIPGRTRFFICAEHGFQSLYDWQCEFMHGKIFRCISPSVVIYGFEDVVPPRLKEDVWSFLGRGCFLSHIFPYLKKKRQKGGLLFGFNLLMLCVAGPEHTIRKVCILDNSGELVFFFLPVGPGN